MSFIAVFDFRVNVLLVVYTAVVQSRLVPAQALVPLLDSYLDFEKWWNPQNFEGYQVPDAWCLGGGMGIGENGGMGRHRWLSEF